MTHRDDGDPLAELARLIGQEDPFVESLESDAFRAELEKKRRRTQYVLEKALNPHRDPLVQLLRLCNMLRENGEF